MKPAELMPIPVKYSPRSDQKFVTFLYALADGLTGNTAFASPTPTPTQFKDAGDALGAANGAAKKGGTAATAARDEKRADAEKLVDQFVGYVHATVRANAGDAATAASMIKSVGLGVHKRTTQKKAPFAAKYGAVSGEVLLVALAVARHAMYFYEVSVDSKTWTSGPQVMKSKATITGLTPGQVYYFRFRAQTRTGMGDYSQVVSLMVH